ncbi:MAG: GtrA family protein [Clostridium sp.]|uniref:GtrA family protein n=1 Tax=Clostridium sp. TaxID=1506 RepID=UPI0025F188E9|nr:GtrA family protein [Clostridium sp.]MCI6691135.1 GtrA family protein [Clostridium sp.]MDY2630743.1 GtrA family protein [Clostridium sp.]
MKILNKRQMGEIIRFGIVGVLATLIQYLVYLIGYNFIGTNIAFTLGYIISLFFNFILSNYFTFKTSPNKEKGVKFLLAHGFNYGLQMILLNFFNFIGIYKAFSPFLVYSISIPVNFLLVRKALLNKDK